MMIYLKINMKGRTNMNNENIRRFYEEVKESLDDNYKIIIESKEDLDEDWVEYDSVKWTVEQPIEKKVNELLNKKSSTLEEKILKLYEYICLNYVYDDNVLFFFRKDLSDPNNIKYIAVDWYGRIVGNEWKDNRQNHNRRVCYEFARVYAKAIKELLDDNNNLDVFMLGDKENLHYVVGLTGPEYSVILDLDDFNSIKDLTRLKLGLTIKGIRILRDNSGKFKDAINKFNVGRKNELAEIEALSSESDKKDFITYLNEIILILNKYNVDKMTEKDMYDILKKALYEFPVVDVEINVPSWIHILPDTNEIKKHYLDKIRESMMSISKLKDVDRIIDFYKNSEYISKAYISNVDTSRGIVTLNLDSDDSLYESVLKNVLGGITINKSSLLKVFMEYSENKDETSSIKSALKMAKSTGYGIVYPTLNDMKLSTPEIIKQGSRYGVKLKAVASSIHLMKVDVESTFEPIIGTEMQSKELINYIMKDYETDPSSIWKSEIFGRSLDVIVKEGIQAKLSMMPEATRYKLSNTVTKIVNKGSNNLIAIVL